ncbi:MAG: NADP-dependent isocitrate dehydrogenase [Acidiferrobacterales bacterium]|nr:NADP-dependent isocitrate dehydrogenase [Acidiferrobacterales bacterium]
MSNTKSKIFYTLTDEAPALATRSLLPIFQSFASACDVDVDTKDISLAARILANLSEYIDADQRVPDALAELGTLVLEPTANVIKTPNVSASIPQIKAAVKELQAKGYSLPDFPDDPKTDEEIKIRACYEKVKGSNVNPVLREGNSDRRAPAAVKNYARNNPHSMGEWKSDSKSHVATMNGGDFRSSERSMTIADACSVKIEFTDNNGNKSVKQAGLKLLEGEVIDAMFMSKKALCKFYEEQIDDAMKNDVLFSLHVKATMMKVSHPIVFGHAVKVFYKDVYEKYATLFEELNVQPNNGLGNLYGILEQVGEDLRDKISTDIDAVYKTRPAIAMVDSDKGISNLHVPSDVIVDASMPAMIRSSGKMWNMDGELVDAKAVIPESTYAYIYQEVIDYCKENGALDPTKIGSVANVGLMAQKAEEYGSHDKTYEMEGDGYMRVIDESNDRILFEHAVEEGDIWRMCQVKDLPIQDWVKLAVTRARKTGSPTVFWLDKNRPHEAQLIIKVNEYLKDHDTDGLDLKIMSPADATRYSLEEINKGNDVISVSGNVLRDYLTDLFPILEVGTSAKMLSIVPLMNGGGLFETGAGGSAPKHVQQFNQEGHLRWDSLGEFLATAASFEHIADSANNPKAQVLADTLDVATSKLLSAGKSPSRKVNELDNRGSHFYLSMFWAEALAEQDTDADLKTKFADLAKTLADNEKTIIDELNSAQGAPVDINGHYFPDEGLAANAMRPSKTFNDIIDGFMS